MYHVYIYIYTYYCYDYDYYDEHSIWIYQFCFAFCPMAHDATTWPLANWRTPWSASTSSKPSTGPLHFARVVHTVSHTDQTNGKALQRRLFVGVEGCYYSGWNLTCFSGMQLPLLGILSWIVKKKKRPMKFRFLGGSSFLPEFSRLNK